jgi:glycosyltransferase involved in cell wall biosynthesis
MRCAGSWYGRPKGWLATLGVLMSRPLLKRKVSGLHSVSEYVEERIAPFLENGNGAVAKQVIHEFIPSDPTHASPDEIERHLTRLPLDPFILFVGALRPIKGLNELISAYSQLESPPPLVLIGTREADTPDVPEGIIVLNDLPHTAVMEAWRRCMFAVLPSLWPEPFGMVLVEAMSMGAAVITTVPGGHGDVVVDEVTGLLVPPGDAAALATAMRRLIDDSTLRTKLARNAQTRANKIVPERFLEAFENLYQDARAPVV